MLMEKAKSFVESLKSKWFPSDEDNVWKQWVDYKNRETRDLIGLLSSDVRDSFKRRAVFLLLVPTAEFNPIYWTEKVGKFYHKTDFLKILSPDLLAYATNLIIEFYSMLKPAHCDKPEHYATGGGGIVFYTSVPDKYHDALCFYNNSILVLLTILPEEQREKIFSLFSLQDISTYNNLDDASGYEPFRSLMCSNVNEKWKIRADATMRQIIKDELAGRTKPREDWEGALDCYANIISCQSYGIFYSTELYADQMKFLVSKEHYGYELINDWKVGSIFQILSADAYKEIRHQIARFVVFGNGNEFKVWSNETLNSAEIMLEQFAHDEDLAQKLQSAIDKGKEKVMKCQKEEEKAKKAEDEIINQMR